MADFLTAVLRSNRRALPPPLGITAGRIFRWAVDRLAEIDADAELPPLMQAIAYRQALMIGFLIARPVRRRALLAMAAEAHLKRTSQGFEVRFGAEDMKDRRARSFPLPAGLVAPMRRYLAEHRPVLLNGNANSGLWISRYGRPLTPNGLAHDLPNLTERFLGVRLRPHAFRHIAATSIAEFDPEHVNIIRDILRHATLDMAEKHYNRATGLSSCNQLQSLMADIQSRPGRTGTGRRRGRAIRARRGA